MPDLINATRADARRLLRQIRSAPTVDAERRLTAALLAQRAAGYRAATDECIELYFDAEFRIETATTDEERWEALKDLVGWMAKLYCEGEY